MTLRLLKPGYRRGHRIQVGWEIEPIEGGWFRVEERHDAPERSAARLVLADGREFWVRYHASYMTRFQPPRH